MGVQTIQPSVLTFLRTEPLPPVRTCAAIFASFSGFMAAGDLALPQYSSRIQTQGVSERRTGGKQRQRSFPLREALVYSAVPAAVMPKQKPSIVVACRSSNVRLGCVSGLVLGGSIQTARRRGERQQREASWAPSHQEQTARVSVRGKGHYRWFESRNVFA